VSKGKTSAKEKPPSTRGGGRVVVPLILCKRGAHLPQRVVAHIKEMKEKKNAHHEERGGGGKGGSKNVKRPFYSATTLGEGCNRDRREGGRGGIIFWGGGGNTFCSRPGGGKKGPASFFSGSRESRGGGSCVRPKKKRVPRPRRNQKLFQPKGNEHPQWY